MYPCDFKSIIIPTNYCCLDRKSIIWILFMNIIYYTKGHCQNNGPKRQRASVHTSTQGLVPVRVSSSEPRLPSVSSLRPWQSCQRCQPLWSHRRRWHIYPAGAYKPRRLQGPSFGPSSPIGPWESRHLPLTGKIFSIHQLWRWINLYSVNLLKHSLNFLYIEYTVRAP